VGAVISGPLSWRTPASRPDGPALIGADRLYRVRPAQSAGTGPSRGGRPPRTTYMPTVPTRS